MAYALAAAFAVTAQAAHRTLDVGLGPVGIVSVTVRQTATSATFGPGLLLVALAGGVLNLGAARVVRRRAERGADHVD